MKGKLLPLQRPSAVVEEMSEEALVAAYGTGDPAAVAALFARFCDPVYRFLSRYVGPDNPDLDDLVQATFLEVMRVAGKFRGGAAVKTWIFGIAINVARHHRRSESRRSRMLDTFLRSGRLHREEAEESAARREKLGRLAGAIRELPESLRAPFVMCDLEGTPGHEAARVLGVPEGTIWRRLHEARKQLRLAIDEEVQS